MPTIGIISDTHGRIGDDALAALLGVDFIIHAGDIGSQRVLLELEAIAPTTAVLGNNDLYDDYGPGVSDHATLDIDGARVFVSHYSKDAERAADSGEYDLAIHGHTHVPRDEVVGKCRIINPGGAFRPRCGSKRQLAIVEIEDGAVGPVCSIELQAPNS